MLALVGEEKLSVLVFDRKVTSGNGHRVPEFALSIVGPIVMSTAVVHA